MAILFSNPWYHPISGSVTTYPGAKLNFYQTGTTTRQDTYTDDALSVAHSNPVIADAAGYFEPIYLDPSAETDYKAVLTDSADAVLQTIDPLSTLLVESTTNTDGGAALVGYKHGGSTGTFTPGATAMDLQVLNDATVRVSMFLPLGYTSDGTVDYSTEIGSAITAAGTYGSLYFDTPGATLGCVDLRPLDGQSWIGNNVTLKQPDQSSVNGSGVITISAKTGITIDGFIIDGNGPNNTFALRPGGWPWHGIVVSSASTDCTIKNCYIYDCEEPINGTGDNADIVIRANSERINVLNCRLGASNNNLIIYNAYHCKVDNCIFEDNTLSEALAIFTDSTGTSRWTYSTVSNCHFIDCRQGVAINEAGGNVISNCVVDNWIDNALSVRWGGNSVVNYYIRSGADTTGTFAVGVTEADVGTTDERNEDIGLTNVHVEWNGHDVTSGNAFQISNTKTNRVTLAACKATNKIAQWEASTVYAVGDKLQPTTLDGYYYIVGAGDNGTSGGTEPTWIASTTDGTVTWTQVDPKESSGFNINASRNIRMVDCVAENMFGSGFKIQSGSKYINMDCCEAFHNREYGLVVGDGSGAFVHVMGGRYFNNAQDQSGKQGIFISAGVLEPQNYNVVIDQGVEVFDDQSVATQNMSEPVFAGAHSGSPISTAPTGDPPNRGIWRVGSKIYSSTPSVTLQGWYCWSVTQTTTDGPIVATDTVIPTTATAGISADDTAGVLLDTGNWHWSSVASVSAGVSITLNDAVPTGGNTASGARVVTHDWANF